MKIIFLFLLLTFSVTATTTNTVLTSSTSNSDSSLTNNNISVTQNSSQPSENKIYTIQLGAFNSRERAFAFYWKISRKLSPVQVIAPSGNEKLYRVWHGSFPNYKEAKAVVEKLKKLNIDCFVTLTKKK